MITLILKLFGIKVETVYEKIEAREAEQKARIGRIVENLRQQEIERAAKFPTAAQIHAMTEEDFIANTNWMDIEKLDKYIQPAGTDGLFELTFSYKGRQVGKIKVSNQQYIWYAQARLESMWKTRPLIFTGSDHSSIQIPTSHASRTAISVRKLK